MSEGLAASEFLACLDFCLLLKKAFSKIRNSMQNSAFIKSITFIFNSLMTSKDITNNMPFKSDILKI
ncbi:hypothetical protein BpHYR1_044194 [Brachionus plicatilis]|uniref:Uncharacterized protein n=1 Tax=Brachionus plicatilis TaxID=10195 RepID=A0A3M7PAL0_BRAPC|nr:hypothetical protein BpHYR1_044194 [Brachionus plicatilis]